MPIETQIVTLEAGQGSSIVIILVLLRGEEVGKKTFNKEPFSVPGQFSRSVGIVFGPATSCQENKPWSKDTMAPKVRCKVS